jgi:hypothetical protein
MGLAVGHWCLTITGDGDEDEGARRRSRAGGKAAPSPFEIAMAAGTLIRLTSPRSSAEDDEPMAEFYGP